MDWEKQDNELRKLMESNEFLPESESWDANANWKKLLNEIQPTQKKSTRIWMAWGIAASVIGLLGIGFYWVQYETDSPINKVVVEKKHVPPVQEQKNHFQKNKIVEKESNVTTSVIKHKEESTVSIKSGTTQKPTRPVDAKITRTNEAINYDPSTEILSATLETPPDNTFTNEKVNPNTTGTSKTADLVAVKPALLVKKPALRIIHYNQLNDKSSMTPPVFVQVKKSEIEYLALQNAGPKKESLPSIKIDFSHGSKN